MKYLLFLLFFAGDFKEEIELDKPKTHVKQKFEVFLWLPPKRHVDNLRTQQNWEVYKYLKKYEKELDSISDFRIVDTNLKAKTIEFKYRINNGPITPFPMVRLKKGEAFYKHIRYLILLNRFVTENERLNTYSFPLMKKRTIKWGIIKPENHDNGYQPYQGLKFEFSYDIANPILEVSPPIRFDRNPNIQLSYKDKINTFGILYSRRSKNRLDFTEKLDYGSGILLDLIQDLKKERDESK